MAKFPSLPRAPARGGLYKPEGDGSPGSTRESTPDSRSELQTSAPASAETATRTAAEKHSQPGGGRVLSLSGNPSTVLTSGFRGRGRTLRKSEAAVAAERVAAGCDGGTRAEQLQRSPADPGGGVPLQFFTGDRDTCNTVVHISGTSSDITSHQSPG